MKSILNTRPIYHKTDDAIRGHVCCSFLALVLKKELNERLEKMDLDLEWY
ncbi:MAG: transposase, partial [Porphyromonadaceae bacterium]